ncbi:hypothetical protein [Frankia sp. AgB32]|uniref:hypothetical protein n=1 Tax=Frankia sp. AgB32 TaxID=631119 RepID=UPI00200D3EC7|nr:hypothetical protein [Frankia sp. AgB32]MCK9896981.1 hypothetical protein [Frankia sp. AgB32]
MATVPTVRTWINELLTATKMNEISSMLNFLKQNSGGVCVAQQTAQQFLGPTADVPINFNSAFPNVDGMWSGGTRLTAQTAGWYMMGGLVTFTAAGGARFGKFRKNNVTLHAASGPAAAAPIETFLDVGTYITFMNPGDYLELTAWQNTGGTIATSVNDGGSQFAVYRIAS